MRGTRVPAIVPSDFRPGTEVVGRLGPSCARTSTTTRNRESAPARTELGRHRLASMPTAAPRGIDVLPPGVVRRRRQQRTIFAAAIPAHRCLCAEILRVRSCRPQDNRNATVNRRIRIREDAVDMSAVALTNRWNVRGSAPPIKRQLTFAFSCGRIKSAKRAPVRGRQSATLVRTRLRVVQRF
jgi:hypothetical protein